MYQNSNKSNIRNHTYYYMLVYQINVTFESHFFLNNEIICFMLVVIYEKYSNLIELD